MGAVEVGETLPPRQMAWWGRIEAEGEEEGSASRDNFGAGAACSSRRSCYCARRSCVRDCDCEQCRVR